MTIQQIENLLMNADEGDTFEGLLNSTACKFQEIGWNVGTLCRIDRTGTQGEKRIYRVTVVA